MSLKQQLHIINGTQTLKSLCTQPRSKEGQRFSSLQIDLKILEGLLCAVCQCIRYQTSQTSTESLLQTWIYVLKETKQNLGVRSRVATLQDQQTLCINRKWKNLSLSHWSLSPFLLSASSFLSHISIFLCLLFFVFLVFILLALDFANVLFYGKPAGANFLLHLSLFPQFAFSLITLFSMLTFVFIAQLHCLSIFSLLSKPLTTFQSYVYVPKQLHLSSIFVCDTLSIACFVQAHIQFYYSIYVSNLWLASTVLIS